jgi:hypothetical protein
MMSFISHSPRAFDHNSSVWHNSCVCEGVRFATRQISLAGRIELTQKVQELISKNDFLQAGDALERSRACMADLLAKRVYLEWGISGIEGLKIDGRLASVQRLINDGPEELCNEIASTIQSELELSEEERKNF